MFDESDDTLRMGRKGQLTANVTLLMLKGGGYAALAVFGIWVGLALLALVGELLPDRSRETPDPVNRSQIELVIEDTRFV